MQNSTTRYAMLSGACAATASLCGKLSGLHMFQGPFIIFRIVFFGIMIVCNGGVWTLYVKALQTADSSLSATVLSASANYFLSAIIGFFFFGEVTSLLWWSGMVLVLFGLILIARDQTQSGDKMLKEVKETKQKR